MDEMTADQREALLYEAWCLISNADWQKANPEWVAAAERWRDKWHGWTMA